jgi:hypothetical protein
MQHQVVRVSVEFLEGQLGRVPVVYFINRIGQALPSL